MAVRVALMIDPHDPRLAAFWGALEKCSAALDVRALRSRGRAPGSLLQLAAYRPDLIISDNVGAPALQAATYRFASRRSRLLLCATEPPRRFSLRERAILAAADGVLADGEVVAQAVAQLQFPPSRIFPLAAACDVDAFLACGRTRSGAEIHRLVYAGDLSPKSGVADVLTSVAAWAEQHRERAVEIWWIGEGDLAGVLGAQPLPGNLSQRFLGSLDPVGIAAAFGQCGLLVIPSLTDDKRSLVLEGLAAGLPVLGSRRNRRVKQLVREGVTGWLFDPLAPMEMSRALGAALASSAEQLDQMRDAGRSLVQPSAAPGFAERFGQAFAAVMPNVMLEPKLGAP